MIRIILLSAFLPQQERGQIRRHGHNRCFRDVARTFFPNAKIIIDRFHVARFCTQAMDGVRKSVQKQLPDGQRRYFKRSRRLLLRHRDEPSDEDRACP